MFKTLFKTIPIPDTPFVITEPSAGMMVTHARRTSLFPKEDRSGMFASVWYALYVVPNLSMVEVDESGNKTITPVLPELFKEFIAFKQLEPEFALSSVEAILNEPTDELFKEFCVFIVNSIPRSKMVSWYELFENEFLLSEKSKAELKKD